MNTYRDIVTEDPIAQVWKLLRSFLDCDFVVARIKALQGVSEPKFSADVRKQAKQIGYCIRQAEEYFRAQSHVGLATRPLLLYYGVISLATAIVLLRQDGSHSLDFLRKVKKHQHHGLNLSRDSLQGLTRSGLGTWGLFSAIRCTVNLRDNRPWGLFGLFYESLTPCCVACSAETRDAGKSTYLSSHNLHLSTDPVPIDSLTGKTLDMLELMKALPDLYFSLASAGIRPALCRGSLKQTGMRHYGKDASGQEKLEKVVETTDWFVDGVAPDAKQALISLLKDKNPNASLVADFGTNLHFHQSIEVSPDLKPYYMPDVLDDVNGRLFYVVPPKETIPEPAAYFILCYCLGMLSRYFPDLWMRIMDERVEVAELTDSFLNIVARKFPNLILDQMTDIKHHVHL